jgi:DNA-binding transcriptional ArsR family regulator
MLDQLFGSKTRVLLLRLFFNNPESFFYVREIARNLDTHLNSIRRELSHLEKLGLITSYDKEDLGREVEKELKDNKKYYKLNSNFVFLEELQSLVIKGYLLLDRPILEKIKKLGKVEFCLLSGAFVGWSGAPADLVIVGEVKMDKLEALALEFEHELAKPINYAVFSVDEFRYRRDVADKFMYDLFEGKNFILIDKLSSKKSL